MARRRDDFDVDYTDVRHIEDGVQEELRNMNLSVSTYSTPASSLTKLNEQLTSDSDHHCSICQQMEICQ